MAEKAKDQPGSSSEEDYSSSGTGDDKQSTPRLFGNLKTRLRWDTASKQLHMDVRQLLESSRSVEVKYKGALNTATGAYQYRGVLRKNFFTNVPSIARIMAQERGEQLDEADEIDTSRLLPAGLGSLVLRDWSLSPGVTVSSDQQRSFAYSVSLRKQPQVVRRSGNLDSWLTFKSNLEFNPKTSQVNASGAVRLKLYKFNFTSTQDARVSVGADFDWQGGAGSGGDGTSKLVTRPYVKIGENSWALRLQRGGLGFTYEV